MYPASRVWRWHGIVDWIGAGREQGVARGDREFEIFKRHIAVTETDLRPAEVQWRNGLSGLVPLELRKTFAGVRNAPGKRRGLILDRIEGGL